MRLKEICCHENAEVLLGMTTASLIELSEYIDETFEYAVTDNEFSRQIFEESNKRRQKIPEKSSRNAKQS